VREYSYTATEHDRERPWITFGTQRHTIELEDGSNFYAWAAERWPAPRWSVELDPWQLSQDWR
jgi:hypothetical protein